MRERPRIKCPTLKPAAFRRRWNAATVPAAAGTLPASEDQEILDFDPDYLAWLGEVETEPTAAPFHDWNERIEHECYRAVVSARIPGPGGRIARLVNTLHSISFDLGPTLATWMEREARETNAAFLQSDRVSRERLGFGNAVATPYHHVILPLCSRRDKVTEVRWGMRDFARRFGRESDGIWLPEAALPSDPEAGARGSV